MLRKIYTSAIKFLAPQTLPEIYATAVEEAVILTEAKYGTIFFEQHGVLHRVYTNVPKERRAEPRRKGFAYKSFKTGKAIVVSSKILKKAHPELYETGVRSLVLIPLAYHNKSLGVLTLQSNRDKHFNIQRLRILKLYGSLVSLAIQKTIHYNTTRDALKARDLFISMAAHELRTPATTIQGYMQLMKKKYQKKEVPPRKWIEILSSETLRLTYLIRELLQIEQIKMGQLKYEWKNNSLKEIIRRLLADAQVTWPHHKVIHENKLDGKSDMVYSDFDKILQALLNILGNAVKFSPRGSKILIQLSYEDPHFKIEIIDEGKGIAKKDLPYIFEGFYKGSDHTKQGMGLGLYLAENIIARHKGFLKVKSQIKKGTTVQIYLPEK